MPACLKDAKIITKELSNLKFDVIEGLNLDRTTLIRRINEFLIAADRYSTVLIYYTGHGVQIDGNNYFVPIDCKYNAIKSVFISSSLVGMNLITDYTSIHPEKISIIMLDACRATLSFSKGIIDEGLAELDSGAGSIISFATAPNTTAGCTADYSYYTQSLEKYISTVNLKVEDMFKLVRQDVIKHTKGEQIPWESTSLKYDFYFNSMTEDEIYEKIYKALRNHNTPEMLILLGYRYRKPLSEIVRIYMKQKAEKPGGIYFTDNNELELYILKQILEWGFVFEKYRWRYKDDEVETGDFYHSSESFK